MVQAFPQREYLEHTGSELQCPGFDLQDQLPGNTAGIDYFVYLFLEKQKTYSITSVSSYQSKSLGCSS